MRALTRAETIRDKNITTLTELRDLLAELKTADDDVSKFTETTEKFRTWATKWCEKFPTDIEYFTGMDITVAPPDNYVPSSTQLNLSAEESYSSENLYPSDSSEMQLNESAQSPSPIFIDPVDVNITPPPPPKKHKLWELANWAYESTIQCAICYEDNADQMIECEACSKFSHLACVGLTEVPKNTWICNVCRETD